MLVKRYRAKDMQEAMDTVIRELGSDAVILNSRKVRKKGLRYLFQQPMQEVMVAYDPAKTPIAKKITSAINAGVHKTETNSDLPRNQESVGSSKDSAAQVNKQQISSLVEKIESLDQVLNGFMNKFTYIKRDISLNYSREMEELLINLVDNMVEEEVAHVLARETEQILKKQHGEKADEILEHLIMKKLGVADPIHLGKFGRKVILAIGPTGVGKTTSIVKLAANFSINQKKKVGIINTDTYRIAAHEQLKTYCDILNIPLRIVYQAEEIGEAFKDMSDREVIFIDTAGKCPGDSQHRKDIEGLIMNACPDEILLCISASTSFPALREIIDTYRYVRDVKLLITKLDEIKYRGMLLNFCCYAEKNIAYVTTGQSVPDDIEIVDPQSVARQLLRPQQ